jgi:uncharacterized protein YbcI
MPGSTAEGSQSVAAQISKLVVSVVHRYTGRGPTKAWTSLDTDLVSVVVYDTLTTGERSLVSDGHEAFVLDMRRAYQRTMRKDLTSGVEQLTGRKVIAFFSDNHIDPDIAVESFVLESSSDGAGRASAEDRSADDPQPVDPRPELDGDHRRG